MGRDSTTEYGLVYMDIILDFIRTSSIFFVSSLSHNYHGIDLMTVKGILIHLDPIRHQNTRSMGTPSDIGTPRQETLHTGFAVTGIRAFRLP